MESTSCASLHWRFSLEIYGAEGVAPSCLTLQDDIGVDVNILLLFLLASRIKNRPMTVDEIAEADDVVKAWREEIVVQLRNLRRRLKSGPPPAPGEQTNLLRNAIKSAELDAERIQQGILSEWLDRRPAGVDSLNTGGRAKVDKMALLLVGRRVVRYYLQAGSGSRNLSKPELYRLAGVVAKAATRVRCAV